MRRIRGHCATGCLVETSSAPARFVSSTATHLHDGEAAPGELTEDVA
jgi:hypothetical protein